MELRELVVIVTGASAGIGAATARVLAEQGANIVLTARRAEKLTVLEAQLAEYAGRRHIMAGDISDEMFCRELVAETVAEFGRVDVLINNAGVGHWDALAEIPAAHLQTVTAVNLYAPIWTTQAAIPHMLTQGRGQIINVSSIVGQRPLQKSAVYCASKTALNFVTRSLRMELHNTPIIVSLVYPGATTSEFQDSRMGYEGKAQRKFEVSAEAVAQAIAKAIEKGKTEIYVTRFDWLFTHLNRLFPRLLDWVFAKVLRR